MASDWVIIFQERPLSPERYKAVFSDSTSAYTISALTGETEMVTLPNRPAGKSFVCFVHVFPPSDDLYKPLPFPPELKDQGVLLNSHIPAYMISGFCQSIATSLHPVFSSTYRIFSQVFPPSDVLYKPRSGPGFQSGPSAATNTVFGSFGSIRILAMRSVFSSPI